MFFFGEIWSSWKICALLAALFAALTAIFAKIGIKDIDSNLATGIRTIVILVLIWGIVFATVPLSDIKSIKTWNWTFLILSGIATGLSWMFYFHAIQIGDVSRVAPIDKMSIVLTIVLAFVFLGETVSWQVVVGGLLIAAGTLCMLWK
jgi:transporter family protein